MARPILSSEQKLVEKKKRNLHILVNGVKSAWFFGQLATWTDVFKRLGYDDTYIEGTYSPDSLSRALVWNDLKAFLDKLQLDLEVKLATAGDSKLNNKENYEQNVSSVSSNSRLKGENKISLQNDTLSTIQNNGTKTTSEDELSNDKDYGLVPSPNEKAFHYWFQKKAIKEIFEKVKQGKSCLLIAGTGKGKTFITYAVARRLIDINFHDNKTVSHAPYMVLTRATIKEQHKRVAKNFYNLDVDDIYINNIEMIRSKEGKFWVKTIPKIIDGEEVLTFQWRNRLQPCVVFFDESQAAKNNDKSKQAQIMCAYNDLPTNNILVSISATPFTRVSEAKCFAVSTHIDLEPLGFPHGTKLTNENWWSFCRVICGNSNPTDYNEAAVQRLMKYLDAYVVRVKGVRSQFNEINRIEKITFQSKEAREFYEKALQRKVEQEAKLAKSKLIGEPTDLHPFAIMTAFMLAAEVCRAEVIADKMVSDVAAGYAACAAVKFKATLIAIEQFLENKHGIKRDQISLIWGGGQTELTAKQKAKKAIKDKTEKLEKMGMNIDELMSDMDLDDVEDRELLNLPASSRLGPQSLVERQNEIDNYQSGKTVFCIYTFKAGGVGLSLHHTDEMCDDWNKNAAGFNEWFVNNDIQHLLDKGKLQPGKVRRKESGYCYAEDVKFVWTRPRRNRVAPTWSAIEMVQGLGRCPRLTSLSDTEQTLLYYTGTIEDDIAAIVSEKLRCLSFVVRMKESWQEMILGGVSKDAFLETTKNVASDTEGAGSIDIDEDEGEE